MNRAIFFARVRKALFGGALTQDQVDGISGILDAFAVVGDGRPKTLAYVLATPFVETAAKYVPMREGCWRDPPGTDAKARAVVTAERYRYAVALPPYGHMYYGRGLPQLTWGDNYKASSEDAGEDLFANPDAMLDPVISARVLIRGIMDGRWNRLGKGIAHYLPDRGPDNAREARRTVNVLDRADEIAGYYRSFLKAIEAAGGVAEAAPASPAPAIDLGALQRLAAWRGDAPVPELATTTAWLERMPA